MATVKRVTTPTKLAPDGSAIIAPNYTVPRKTNTRVLRPKCGLGQFSGEATALYYSDSYYQTNDHFLELPGAICAIDYWTKDQYGNLDQHIQSGPYWYVPDETSIHYSSTNGINKIPNKQKSLGFIKYIKDLTTKATNALINSALNYDGGVYNKVLYNGPDSVQARYNRGEFGPKNSPEALYILDTVKGYLGRELLVKPVLQEATLANHLQNAIDNYTSQVPTIHNILTKGLNAAESVASAQVSVLAEFMWQGKEFFVNDIMSSNSPYKNTAAAYVHEITNLKGQIIGATSVNPPEYLVGKTFTGMTTDGSTVTFEFNSNGYTRTVTPP